ncbi:hypothetical protein LEP1GSC185_1396 [Leptospira licerasiae serovar Varillal str. VAR 010]|uniref:Uncharacterized protein n=2 Tax=Leptospira licerasiae TaxID=447106 RepID=A0ABN0H759_9LEPT|nr:hypothetical protein LEP1GSC185_1396 [Leptospira licerasiae serovar Varillal str. VAR 010]EJZ41052.1 hypothetical protein LEP1GSC178_0659 [Leptospira licerasiae str. MMD4847]
MQKYYKSYSPLLEQKQSMKSPIHFVLILFILSFIFQECYLSILRNSQKEDREGVISERKQNSSQFGLIVVYETDHSLNSKEAILAVQENLEKRISPDSGIKLLGFHQIDGYSKLEGQLKNVLVLRISHFAHRRHWLLYVSMFTLFILPGLESQDFRIKAILYDGGGEEIVLPEIEKDIVYRQLWQGWLLLPFYWLSESESMVATYVMKTVRHIREGFPKFEKLRGPIQSEYKVVKAKELDFGTKTIRPKIVSTQRVDSFKMQITGGGGPPRIRIIYPENPEENFIKVTVNFENSSDANAKVSPSLFSISPKYKQVHGAEISSGETDLSESFMNMATYIEFIPYDPKQLFLFKKPYEPFELRPESSMGRVFYFRYPKSKEPIFYTYDGVPCLVDLK